MCAHNDNSSLDNIMVSFYILVTENGLLIRKSLLQIEKLALVLINGTILITCHDEVIANSPIKC